MLCPFPGMDPYLQTPAFWADFHASFIVSWSETLNDRLPDHYDARIDVRVVRERIMEEAFHGVESDLTDHRSRPENPIHGKAADQATLEPKRLPRAVLMSSRRRHIEIRRLPDRSLVAVLELRSPDDIDLNRHEELLDQDVHLIELDLMLGGSRIELGRPLPRGDYYCLITRAERRDDCDVYSWTIRDPLPTLPVPLLAPDPDILIDYAAVFATTFARGRYARSLAYDQAPEAPVRPDDLAWVRERASSIRR